MPYSLLTYEHYRQPLATHPVFHRFLHRLHVAQK